MLSLGEKIKDLYVNVLLHVQRVRFLEDWLKLSKEALRLACNAINIDSTGSQAVLARRLFDNYHLDSDQLIATSSSSSDQSPIFVAPAQVQLTVLAARASQNNSILAPEFDIRAFLRPELQSF